jgi:ankyrin repeat protein
LVNFKGKGLERNKKFTEASIADKDYKKLFGEIKQCGMRAWDKRSKEEKKKKRVVLVEHSQYPSYTVLDFKNLYEYLIELLGGDKRRKIDFEDAINNSGVSSITFRQGASRHLSSDKVKSGLEAAAEFFDIPLIQLLADFLADCEDDGNKIRLAAHAQYEEIIKSFIHNAPELVRELEVEATQISTQEIQEHWPVQTLAETRHRIERVEGQDKWLDPNNFDELPLVGRKNEIELLDNFIKSDGQFKIWAIAGPSGSGKTRLACQWAYSSAALEGWDRRVLHKEDRTEPKKWAAWIPDKPTLIIIDYLYGFEKVVLKLISRRLDPTAPKIRLLLIDHVFSEPLYSDKRWRFSGDQPSFNRNEKYFFKSESLNLEETKDQETIIKSIIADRTGIDIESPQIEEAQKYLSKTQGAYHPLFAALVADAINLDKDFKVWNRRELINYYLSGEKRLPWENERLGLNGRWVSHFIAVATARRGVAYKGLKKAAGKCKSRPKHFAKVKEICQKIVTDKNPITLKPFEPDILGESFFLKFLKFIEDSPDDYQPEFQKVFIAGDEGTQVNDATELIAFIQRLTRNLLNDDQSQEETQELWQTLFDFMRPSEFENAEPIRWALTAGLIDIVDAIKNKFSEEKLTALLNQVDPIVFYHVHNSSLLEKSMLYSMRCYELTSKIAKIKPEFSEEMAALFDRYIKSYPDRDTPLIAASSYGFSNIVSALIDRRLDTEERNVSGQNALLSDWLAGQVKAAKRLNLNIGTDIHAIDIEARSATLWALIRGDVEVAKQLFLLDNDLDIHAADKEGLTALIVASRSGLIKMTKLLLDKGADIHAADNEGFTALIWACTNGRVDVAKLLIDKGADIYAADNEGLTALLWASRVGHIDVVKLLIDKGADIHAADNEGFTALIWACTNGRVDVAKLLIDKGADIYAADNEGLTALLWASRVGHIDVVKLLIDKGADIHAADNEGFTALIWACTNGRVDVAKLLIDKGADIHATEYLGFTALIRACIGDHVDVAKLLIGKGADIYAAENLGFTALFRASIDGHVDLVNLLLDKGADIYAADNEGLTALLWASRNGHTDVAKLLLDKGADIHATDNEGFTALIWASIYGHIDVAKLLIDKGVDIHAVDNRGYTALVRACINGHVDVAKLLIDEGANIDAIDNGGRRALIRTCISGSVSIAKLLIDEGENIDATDSGGRTALAWASRNSLFNMAKLLIDEGADIHAADNEGRTALIWTCINGNVSIAKLLIDEGANLDAIDNRGRTALIWACINGSVSIAKLLINKVYVVRVIRTQFVKK